jgi:hypothetical protein
LLPGCRARVDECCNCLVYTLTHESSSSCFCFFCECSGSDGSVLGTSGSLLAVASASAVSSSTALFSSAFSCSVDVCGGKKRLDRHGSQQLLLLRDKDGGDQLTAGPGCRR